MCMIMLFICINFLPQGRSNNNWTCDILQGGFDLRRCYKWVKLLISLLSFVLTWIAISNGLIIFQAGISWEITFEVLFFLVLLTNFFVQQKKNKKKPNCGNHVFMFLINGQSNGGANFNWDKIRGYPVYPEGDYIDQF